MRVLVFGDSITQGLWDVEGGWVSRLRKIYDQRIIETGDFSQPVMLNLGVSGDSSDEILARFDNEAKARARDELAFIFAVGVNDARTKAGVHFSSIERYLENLTEITNQARKYSDKILFVGLTPCVDARSNHPDWGRSGFENARIKEFDNALRDFCGQNNLQFVEVYEPFQELQANIDSIPDGVHPNGEGHQLIARLVEPALDKLVN